MSAITNCARVISILLLTSLTATANDPNLGFFRLDTPRISPALANSAKAVFRIKVVSLLSGDEWNLTNKNEFNLLKNKIAQMNTYDRQIAANQIQYCRVNRDDKACFISVSGPIGSAFFIKPKNNVSFDSVLVTARHVVNDAFDDFNTISRNASTPEQKVKLNLLLSQNMAISRLIYIFDHRGKLVPKNNISDFFYIQYAKNNSNFKLKGSEFPIDPDLAVIYSDKGFTAPTLKIAENMPPVGSSVTTLGYPACTDCDQKDRDGKSINDYLYRARPEGRNSNGRNIYYVKGLVVDQSIGDKFLGLSYMKILSDTEVIYRTGDNQEGMSGGPTLNENSEVVGVNIMTQKNPNSKIHINASVIINENKLKKFFE